MGKQDIQITKTNKDGSQEAVQDTSIGKGGKFECGGKK
jgi:hypothetical protein